MHFFLEALLRLKQQLGVNKDQDVAQMLGLTKNAFSERKRRDAFPEKELRELSKTRPELGIDVDYVLTGVDAAAQRARAAYSSAQDVARRSLRAQIVAREPSPPEVLGLPADPPPEFVAAIASGMQAYMEAQRDEEFALLENWRRCNTANKAALSQIVASLALCADQLNQRQTQSQSQEGARRKG